MELRHLRYFLAVAEELSFTRAAERLHIAQPPLSQQIRQLEEELGVLLLERSERPLQLTEAGTLFAKRAHGILDAVEGAKKEMSRVARGITGQLSVGFVGSAMYSLLPSVLSKFRKTSPGTELILRETRPADIASALRSKHIDIGFSCPSLAEEEELNQRVLLEEPYLAAVAPDHPFAHRESLALMELDGEPLILYPPHPEPNMTVLFMKACASAGFQLRIVQEVIHTHTALGLAASGVGITIVPNSVRMQSRRDLHFVPLQAPAPAAVFTAAWRRDASSAELAEFLKTVEDAGQRVLTTATNV